MTPQADRWAIVIGVDDYGGGKLDLSAAVADAERFRDWVVSENGGKVPKANLRLLLGRAGGVGGDVVPTKDNIVTAINEVVTQSGGGGECLFVFFAGHGLTARVSNRDESALVTQGFDELHPDHSLAVRSLTEFLETTQFLDQFFFLDACRDVPWHDREFEIGRWPIPRRRDPGTPPVQQFVLHATSPGLTAAEVGWPGEAVGAFTDVLMAGLDGKGRAKAWSWERACYEVRWENLARYVKEAMEARRHATSPAGEPPPEGWPIQIPQDNGARGVEGRERDALLASFSRAREPLRLEIELHAEPAHEEAEVSVLDAVAEPVASALKVTGTSHTFTLPPKTYAVRAKATDRRVGRLKAPVDLYEDAKVAINLEEPVDVARGEVDEPLGGGGEPRVDDRPGTILVEPSDPLSAAELRDEAGNVVEVQAPDPNTGRAAFSVRAGFYRVRLVGPAEGGIDQFVVLNGGEEEGAPDAKPPAPSGRTIALTEAAGGRYDTDRRTVVVGREGEVLEWAAPSTVAAVVLGDALGGDAGGLEGLGVPSPLDRIGEGGTGVALVAVRGEDAEAGPALSVRLWAAGEAVPADATRLEWSPAGVSGFAERVGEPGQRWLALEQGEEVTVLALPVLAGRAATVIAQVEPDGVRLYQLHPVSGAGASSSAARLRRVEHLERLLLAGRLDGARSLAEELSAGAREDPLAGCLAGYVLLRLGLHELLPAAAGAVTAVAPSLCDAYILRGEYEAFEGNRDAAAQAFADAVNVGVPAFGEGLTRLVEGLRASGFVHPRGALVRHIFQRHARGSMWAAFTPRRGLEPGRLVISGADLGFEG